MSVWILKVDSPLLGDLIGLRDVLPSLLLLKSVTIGSVVGQTLSHA